MTIICYHETKCFVATISPRSSARSILYRILSVDVNPRLVSFARVKFSWRVSGRVAGWRIFPGSGAISTRAIYDRSRQAWPPLPAEMARSRRGNDSPARVMEASIPTCAIYPDLAESIIHASIQRYRCISFCSHIRNCSISRERESFSSLRRFSAICSL